LLCRPLTPSFLTRTHSRPQLLGSVCKLAVCPRLTRCYEVQFHGEPWQAGPSKRPLDASRAVQCHLIRHNSYWRLSRLLQLRHQTSCDRCVQHRSIRGSERWRWVNRRRCLLHAVGCHRCLSAYHSGTLETIPLIFNQHSYSTAPAGSGLYRSNYRSLQGRRNSQRQC